MLYTMRNEEHFYLSGRHFSAMLVAACLVHMIIIMVYLLMPKDKIDKIPVHVLNIKLGNGDIGSMGGGGNGGQELPPRIVTTVAQQPLQSPQAASQSRSAVIPAKPAVAAAPIPAPVPVQARNETAAPVAQEQPQAAAPRQEAPATHTSATATPLATNSRPAQYVRAGQGEGEGIGNGSGYGYGDGRGSRYGNSTSAEAEVMHRYTQLISMWVNRHKQLFTQSLQPGMKGNIIVRLQIDRAGNILYFKLDKGTGVPAVDTAAGAMVRAANPVPPVPGNYPGGNLFEFLISVGYTAQ